MLLVLGSCAGSSPERSSDPAATAQYRQDLQNLFYGAWQPPEVVGAPPGRLLSLPVDVVIDDRGRVLDFQMRKRSGYPAFDASVAAVATQVRKVKAPPGKGGDFRLRINFDLDVER
jgi:TonB family protein